MLECCTRYGCIGNRTAPTAQCCTGDCLLLEQKATTLGEWMSYAREYFSSSYSSSFPPPPPLPLFYSHHIFIWIAFSIDMSILCLSYSKKAQRSVDVFSLKFCFFFFSSLHFLLFLLDLFRLRGTIRSLGTSSRKRQGRRSLSAPSSGSPALWASSIFYCLTLYFFMPSQDEIVFFIFHVFCIVVFGLLSLWPKVHQGLRGSGLHLIHHHACRKFRLSHLCVPII